jgi:(heptosyl)LPS beta-1,4-glucosyltransferase
MPVAKISALILARNERENLPITLASLAGWVDEVVVVDGASTDGTADVARKAGAKVFVREPRSAIDEDRPFAVGKATGDWLFFVDADEVVPPALGKALRQAAVEGKADAVSVPEESLFIGRRADVWAPRRKVRLFRREALEVSDRIHAFARAKPGSKVLHLAPRAGRLVHYWVDGVDPLLARLSRYTRIEAEQAGPRRLGGARLAAILGGQFLRSYLRHGGWRRGWRGLYLSAYHAFTRATVAVRRDELAQGGAAAIRDRYRQEARRVAEGKE